MRNLSPTQDEDSVSPLEDEESVLLKWIAWGGGWGGPILLFLSGPWGRSLKYPLVG